jgi:hypothetical protein
MLDDKQIKDLVHAYQNAGSPFLAYRMRFIFDPVKTEEDRVLNNESLAELREMVGDKMPLFIDAVAKEVLRLAVKSDEKSENKDE